MQEVRLSSPLDDPDWTLRAAAKTLGAWLLVGLAIRLLLLPLCMHPDLVSVYDRVRLLREGRFELSDYSFQALPILVHDAWARLTGVTLPDFSGVRWPNPSEGEIFEQTRRLFAEPQALVWLSLWKLPYALLDLCVGCAIAWAVPRAHARFAGALWLVHPLALYASSAFAKYEPFMLLPLVLGLGSLLRGRTARAAVLIGIAGAMRVYPLLLVPPLALTAAADTRRRAEFLALAAAPSACVLVASALGTSAAWWLAAPLACGLWWLYTRVRGSRGEWLALLLVVAGACATAPSIVTRLFALRYSVDQLVHHSSFLTEPLRAGSSADIGVLSPFFLGYGLLVLWTLKRSLHVADGERGGFALETALLCAACFYGLSFFHPQYIALLAALACASLHRARGLATAHGLQIAGALLMLLAFPGGHTTVQLFLPLAPDEVASLPEPVAALPKALAALPWASIGRTLLALGGAWTVIELARRTSADIVSGARASANRCMLWIGIAAWPAAALAYVVCCLQPSVTSLRPTGEVLGLAKVKGQAPLDFTVGDAAPSGLLVSTRQTSSASEPALWRVQFFAVGGEAGVPAAELLLTDDEVHPGAIEGLAPGTLQIPLERVQLDPHVRYRTVLSREAPAPSCEQRIEALERVAARDLLESANHCAYHRMHAARASLAGPAAYRIDEELPVSGGPTLHSTWLALVFASALGAVAWFVLERRARLGSAS